MDIAVCVRLVYCTLYNCAYKWRKTNLYRITYYLYIHAFEYTHRDKDTFIKWNHTVSWESELWCSEIYQEKNQIKAHFFTLQLIVFVFFLCYYNICLILPTLHKKKSLLIIFSFVFDFPSVKCFCPLCSNTLHWI